MHVEFLILQQIFSLFPLWSMWFSRRQKHLTQIAPSYMEGQGLDTMHLCHILMILAKFMSLT